MSSDWMVCDARTAQERDDYRALLVMLVKVDNQWEFYDDVVLDAIKTLERYDAKTPTDSS